MLFVWYNALMSIPTNESRPDYEPDSVIRNPNLLGAAAVFEVEVGKCFRQVDLRGIWSFARTIEVLPGKKLDEEGLSDVIFFDENGRASINAREVTAYPPNSLYPNGRVTTFEGPKPLAEMGITQYIGNAANFWDDRWASIVEEKDPEDQI
jgi:hypothetical protein